MPTQAVPKVKLGSSPVMAAKRAASVIKSTAPANTPTPLVRVRQVLKTSAPTVVKEPRNSHVLRPPPKVTSAVNRSVKQGGCPVPGGVVPQVPAKRKHLKP